MRRSLAPSRSSNIMRTTHPHDCMCACVYAVCNRTVFARSPSSSSSSTLYSQIKHIPADSPSQGTKGGVQMLVPFPTVGPHRLPSNAS